MNGRTFQPLWPLLISARHFLTLMTIIWHAKLSIYFNTLPIALLLLRCSVYESDSIDIHLHSNKMFRSNGARLLLNWTQWNVVVTMNRQWRRLHSSHPIRVIVYSIWSHRRIVTFRWNTPNFRKHYHYYYYYYIFILLISACNNMYIITSNIGNAHTERERQI